MNNLDKILTENNRQLKAEIEALLMRYTNELDLKKDSSKQVFEKYTDKIMSIIEVYKG